MQAIENKSEIELLHDTKFLRLVRKDGWVWATRNKVEDLPNRKINAVFIVPIIVTGDGTERLCLIQQYRKSLQAKKWSLPAGLIDEGESIEDAAKRELFEETGLKVKEVVEVSKPMLSSSAGVTDELGAFVFCEVEGEISKANLEPDEDIDAYFFTKEEIYDLLSDSSIILSERAYLVCLMFLLKE